jgi:steroid delta-isomerase-like uncharacterized protein
MGQSMEDRIRFANDELIGQDNASVVDEVFSSGYVVHFDGKQATGRAFVRKFIKQLRTALPDLRVVEVECLMQAGDRIAWQRTLSGTHKNALKGIPASGRKVKWRDMLVTRFDGGMIAEEWAVSELAEKLLLKLPRA